MPSLSRLTALLLVLSGVSDAKIEFTSSTLYGIYDFQGVDEVPLPRCDAGCLIFISSGAIYMPSDDGFDPYLKNLLIYDPASDKNLTVAELSRKIDDKTSQKVPLEFTENGTYSIVNLNVPDDKGTALTIWVIERDVALNINYEIYEAFTTSRTPAVPSNVVTFISAQPFRVLADAGEANSYTARLVGFDNALDNNPDDCVAVTKTPVGSSFDGFEFQVDGPLISIVFANKKKVDLKADSRFWWQRNLPDANFITSSGYIGCARLGEQSHRSKFDNTAWVIQLQGEPDFYKVEVNANTNLADGELFLNDLHNIYVKSLKGKLTNAPYEFVWTTDLAVQYGGMAGAQSFLLQFDVSFVQAGPTDPPTTTTVITPCPAATFPTSTSTLTPTTSAVGSVTGLVAVASVILRLH